MKVSNVSWRFVLYIDRRSALKFPRHYFKNGNEIKLYNILYLKTNKIANYRTHWKYSPGAWEKKIENEFDCRD